MCKIIINCVGCGEEINKNLCEKVYRGQKNYGFICPTCREEMRHKRFSREASNTATDKATSSYYTLTINVDHPTDDINGWLEHLGYSVKNDNFGKVDYVGNEIQGFQQISATLRSYDKRFDRPYKLSVHCRDLRGNEIDVDSIELVRLFSKYKGYEKVLEALGE